MFTDEGDANFEQGSFLWSPLQQSSITNQCPNAVLIFNVIEYTQLSRHRNRHVEQAATLCRVFESEPSAEGCDIN
jgi:hypothetical protein